MGQLGSLKSEIQLRVYACFNIAHPCFVDMLIWLENGTELLIGRTET